MPVSIEIFDATALGAALQDTAKATSTSLKQVLPTAPAELWRTDHNGNVVDLEGKLLRPKVEPLPKKGK